jgi:hypothetical protein
MRSNLPELFLRRGTKDEISLSVDAITALTSFNKGCPSGFSGKIKSSFA